MDSAKKKLLFVSHNLELEGAPRSFFMLAKGLKNRGYDVNVFSFKNGPWGEKYEKEGIKVSIVESDASITKEVQEFPYDFVFINTIGGYGFIKRNKAIHGKFIWIIRESEYYSYKKDWPDFDENLFSKATKIVFVCDATRKIYDSVIKEKATVIYNGFDLSEYENYFEKETSSNKIAKERLKNILRKKYSFSNNARIIISVGTLCLRKGQIEFCQAIKILLDSIPKAEASLLKFLIIGSQSQGEDIACLNSLKDFIDENKLNENIILLKETDKIYDYFVIADILVCNSFIESFPRTILEAMAFELPIIATRVYGIPEQIRDGEEGLLVMAGDVKGLSDKMKFLLHNKESAIKMALNAKQRLEKEFTDTITVDKFENLLNEIL